MTSEPDELYTLRAQYWLGHYSLAITEAKSMHRRPLNPLLKMEKEEFLARSYLAMKQYDEIMKLEMTGAVQAIVLKGQFDATYNHTVDPTTTVEMTREKIVNQLKSMVSMEPYNTNPMVHVIVAQVLLVHGQVKEALQLVHSYTTHLECILLCLQIYIKIDRVDLAMKQLSLLRKQDEDSIVTQLGSIYVSLAVGSTLANEAIHTINMLSEQYGSSPYLLNLLSCAYLQRGDYTTAEEKLQECLRDFNQDSIIPPDTYINMIVCFIHQNKTTSSSNSTTTTLDSLMNHMRQQYPFHPFCTGLDRVMVAFDREAIKYKV